ncbi:helix-turn-helix domain-containing protein [Acidisoma cladoniae]
MSVDEEFVKARAIRLLEKGLSTKVICERVGRTERWLASMRLLRAKESV